MKSEDFNNEEIWKDIPEFEGMYQVSNLGRVKRLQMTIIRGGQEQVFKERVLNGSLTADGYQRVSITINKVCKYRYVHILVAKAFLDNPENKPYVDHINTIRTDNRVENLRWATPTENNNNELSRQHMSNGSKKSVAMYTKDMKYIKTYSSPTDAEVDGFRRDSIYRCCRGERKTYKGYIWRYETD